MSKLGKTTGNLKMRSGPGMEYEPPIAYLTPDTELEILEELGDWLKVKAAGKEGYVGQEYVTVTSATAERPSAAPTGIGKAYDRDDEGGGLKKKDQKPKTSGSGQDHAEGKVNKK